MIIKHKTQGNFTIVPNEILRDENLSLQAKGLCVYILSLPKSWRINIENVAQNVGISKNTAYKYLKELINAGILKKAQIKDEKGQFTKEGIYFIGFEKPQEQNLGKKNEQKNNPCPITKICESVQDVKNGSKSLQSEVFTDYQNLNTINKDSKDKKRESKNARESKKKTSFYLLNSLEQKRLLSLCFSRATKETELDLSALNSQEQEAFNRFIEYRSEGKRIKLSTKKAILERILKSKKCGATSQDIANAIEKSIINSWQGLFIKNRQAHNTKSLQKQSDEILAQILEQHPSIDFNKLESFLSTHLVGGRAVSYENGLFKYVG